MKEEHDDECLQNHAGSAKSMEHDGAEILWTQSVEKRNLRYTTFVGDEDSSSLAVSIRSVHTVRNTLSRKKSVSGTFKNEWVQA